MNINDLPVDCLVLILSKFSLQKSISSLRAVCKLWSTTIETVLCRKRRSLKLFGRLKNITDSCLTSLVDNCSENEPYKLSPKVGVDDDLTIDSYIYCDDAQEMNSFLGRLFSNNVQTLSVHFCWDAPFSGLPLLLQNSSLKNNLTTLTLSGAIDRYPHCVFTDSLCEAINQLPFLFRLDLLVVDLFLLDNSNIHKNDQEPQPISAEIEMPQVLSRLEHFSLCNYKGDLISVVEQLSSKHLKSLRLDLPRDLDPVELLEELVEVCPDILEHLTNFRLSLPDLREVNDVVRLISSSCKRLTFLDLQCCSFVNFEMIKLNSTSINQLNCLENLTELRLSHVGVNLNCLTKGAHYRLPQLKNIKRLFLSQVALWPRETTSGTSSLYIETSTDQKLWEAVASIFPSLDQINVRVKKDSVKIILNYLKNLYTLKSTQINVYSAEDQKKQFFGHRKQYECNSKTKGGIFFSECFFERINNL